MSLFDFQDVCMAIEYIATLDLPMAVDSVVIFVRKGPYCMLTFTNWFLQALSVIPRGSWDDVTRCFTMIRWPPPVAAATVASRHFCVPSEPVPATWRGDSIRGNLLCFLGQGSKGIWKLIVDRIRQTIGDSIVEVLLPRKTRIVGAGCEVTKGKYF
ncbi:hypothetical protein F511_31545 [Dorcoceras hygrometricum]|uniref:Uncharacterized protein n=1 Tax=Dorcoceras hygrometricum TaxID=472368 RepID=A0A2Z7BFS9_9LAMI|nr:hypothetical protein F511_31545 [Dorcoceras hygrometricum]